MTLKEFVNKWEGQGNEKQHTQKFWIDLLTAIGVNEPTAHALFERPVRIKGKQKYIDVLLPSVKVLVEQKSLGIDLDKPELQSDGEMLTPYEQGKRYSDNLKVSMKPRWIVTCNFQEFHIHDMDVEQPELDPLVLKLDELSSNQAALNFLVKDTKKKATKEEQISIDAGKIVSRLYNAFLELYGDEEPETLKMLNILIVRLVFLMYCEDAGILAADQFSQFVDNCTSGQLRRELLALFETLNTPNDKRSKYMDPSLSSFDYMNGGLFKDEIDIPPCTEEIRQEIINAGRGFDWSGISPTIFGATFESSLNPETRREGGMHYTSLENIHKVIDPLFLDSLSEELDQIMQEPVIRIRRNKLEKYQDKLASLKFLDPAAGSGNFLTESYLCLRRLENQVIRELIDTEKKGVAGQIVFGTTEMNPIKVSIQQFYGIEINDFAVSVAMTALWIAEAQTIRETEEIINMPINFLPLETYTNIHEGNALRMDWNDVVPADKVYKIMGNPPFVGKSYQSPDQKKDMADVCKGIKGYGNLDYVACWYIKAARYINDTLITCAFVSTNSICQGIAVPPLWNYLQKEKGVTIQFAYQTFRWESEATDSATVHCVIVGFGYSNNKTKRIYTSDGNCTFADNINAYLIDAPNIIVEDRHDQICGAKSMAVGSFPTDGGSLVIKESEYDEFVKKEPNAEQFIREYIGPNEFIKRKKRYCLWLKGCSPAKLKKMPLVIDRISAVKKYRENSSKEQTRKRACIPHLFAEDRQPDNDYILIPRTSSERRRYLPMGFMSREVIAGDTIILPNASLYDFGILESNVHMAWMRTVCGRLESRYRYSNTIVYNNFPWPTPTDKQREKIEKTAQGILDARALYPDSSIADLYDPLTMPSELLRAHQANDKAVMEAYGFDWRTMTEEVCVAELMKMYQELAKKKEGMED